LKSSNENVLYGIKYFRKLAIKTLLGFLQIPRKRREELMGGEKGNF
jgi:hypothetical protein